MHRTARRFATTIAAALTLALAVAAPARAVRTSSWIVTRAEEFKEATLDKVAIEIPGTLVLSPEVAPIGDGSALYGWSLARDASGTLFLGTGDEGKVLRIGSDGAHVEWFDTIELEILSLAVDGKGRLFAGGSPDGTIFSITGKGEGQTFIDTPESYIWAMTFDDAGNLYAATGTRGLIYKIDAQGKGNVFYEASDKNILSLVYDAKRRALIAGTEGRGLVIEIGLDARGRVLFDSEHEEIGALVVTADGTIYAAGSGTASGGGSKDDDGEGKKSNGGGDQSDGKTEGVASVYRISTDDVVTRLWASDEEFIYALVMTRGGRLVAGTGNEGALYDVDPVSGDGTLLVRLTESQVLDAIETPAGVTVSTGNLANVYRIGPSREKSGTVRSTVHDAGNTASWGTASWIAETPSGTGLTLRTRGGNTETPDDTWSDWSAPLNVASESKITSARSRFLQWEAELTGGGEATPRLLEVRVAYAQANLAPRVADVEVFPQGTEVYEGEAEGRPKQLFQVLPNGVRVEFSTERRDDVPLTEALEPWARTVRAMRWDAIDPNGDILSYDVYYRANDEEKWKLLKEKLDITYLAWDSEAFPDGEYVARVVASDRVENPESEALSAEALSEPFFVDNAPPEITGLAASRAADGRLEVRASARDAASFLRRARYAVDAKDWLAVGPADGLFDSRAEQFEFRTESVEAGEHTVVLKVYDEGGNARVAKVVVR